MTKQNFDLLNYFITFLHTIQDFSYKLYNRRISEIFWFGSLYVLLEQLLLYASFTRKSSSLTFRIQAFERSNAKYLLTYLTNG